jgi:hypothetical protein
MVNFFSGQFATSRDSSPSDGIQGFWRDAGSLIGPHALREMIHTPSTPSRNKFAVGEFLIGQCANNSGQALN